MEDGHSIRRRLSRAQRAVAARRKLHPGCSAADGRGVFFYREEEDYTERWLISRSGSVLDRAQFSNSGRE